MRRTLPSCSGSAPTSIHARPSATKATPARPTAKPHAIAASFPSSRPRRTRRTGPPSSPERSTGGVPASSRPSASSNASSASPYAARRQSETLLPSSRSSQASSWPNPSTRPRRSNKVLSSGEQFGVHLTARIEIEVFPGAVALQHAVGQTGLAVSLAMYRIAEAPIAPRHAIKVLDLLAQRLDFEGEDPGQLFFRCHPRLGDKFQLQKQRVQATRHHRRLLTVRQAKTQ